MTYYVSSGTLNPTHSLAQQIVNFSGKMGNVSRKHMVSEKLHKLTFLAQTVV